MNDPHFAFIFAAYAISAAVIASLVAVAVVDHLRLKSALSRLPPRGEDG